MGNEVKWKIVIEILFCYSSHGVVHPAARRPANEVTLFSQYYRNDGKYY